MKVCFRQFGCSFEITLSLVELALAVDTRAASLLRFPRVWIELEAPFRSRLPLHLRVRASRNAKLEADAPRLWRRRATVLGSRRRDRRPPRRSPCRRSAGLPARGPSAPMPGHNSGRLLSLARKSGHSPLTTAFAEIAVDPILPRHQKQVVGLGIARAAVFDGSFSCGSSLILSASTIASLISSWIAKMSVRSRS